MASRPGCLDFRERKRSQDLLQDRHLPQLLEGLRSRAREGIRRATGVMCSKCHPTYAQRSRFQPVRATATAETQWEHLDMLKECLLESLRRPFAHNVALLQQTLLALPAPTQPTATAVIHCLFEPFHVPKRCLEVRRGEVEVTSRCQCLTPRGTSDFASRQH